MQFFFFFSPQGLKFRSRASLHAFLLENPDGNLDINLFDFTLSKSDKVTDISHVKRMRKKKKPTDQLQEDSAEILDPPQNDFARGSSTVRTTKDEKTSIDPCHINTGTVPVEIQPALEVQTASSCIVDDITQQRSPQRVGLLREKLLRLFPTENQQNAPLVHNDKQADSHHSVQPPNVEPATESENEGEDERGGEETQIHRGGDNESNSELDAVANGGCDVEEVLLPEVTAGRESQNSKYDLHADSLLKQKFPVSFFLV